MRRSQAGLRTSTTVPPGGAGRVVAVGAGRVAMGVPPGGAERLPPGGAGRLVTGAAGSGVANRYGPEETGRAP